jgi:hypothetical protein
LFHEKEQQGAIPREEVFVFDTLAIPVFHHLVAAFLARPALEKNPSRNINILLI